MASGMTFLSSFGLSQDFRFGFLDVIDYIPNRLRWSRFFHSFLSRAAPAVQEGGPVLPLPGTENPRVPHLKRSFIHLSIPTPSIDLFACPPPAGCVPV